MHALLVRIVLLLCGRQGEALGRARGGGLLALHGHCFALFPDAAFCACCCSAAAAPSCPRAWASRRAHITYCKNRGVWIDHAVRHV